MEQLPMEIFDNKDTPLFLTQWKAYSSTQKIKEFIELLAGHPNFEGKRYLLALSPTHLNELSSFKLPAEFILGAKSLDSVKTGTFTESVATSILKKAGANFVLLGGHESRHVLRESDESINKKVHRLLNEKLQPILCIGETLNQAELGPNINVLADQLKNGLEGLDEQQKSQVVIFYEAPWVLTTPKKLNLNDTLKAHEACREALCQALGNDLAEKITVIYALPEESIDLQGLLKKASRPSYYTATPENILPLMDIIKDVTPVEQMQKAKVFSEAAKAEPQTSTVDHPQPLQHFETKETERIGPLAEKKLEVKPVKELLAEIENIETKEIVTDVSHKKEILPTIEKKPQISEDFYEKDSKMFTPSEETTVPRKVLKNDVSQEEIERTAVGPDLQSKNAIPAYKSSPNAEEEEKELAAARERRNQGVQKESFQDQEDLKKFPASTPSDENLSLKASSKNQEEHFDDNLAKENTEFESEESLHIPEVTLANSISSESQATPLPKISGNEGGQMANQEERDELQARFEKMLTLNESVGDCYKKIKEFSEKLPVMRAQFPELLAKMSADLSLLDPALQEQINKGNVAFFTENPDKAKEASGVLQQLQYLSLLFQETASIPRDVDRLLSKSRELRRDLEKEWDYFRNNKKEIKEKFSDFSFPSQPSQLLIPEPVIDLTQKDAPPATLGSKRFAVVKAPPLKK